MAIDIEITGLDSLSATLHVAQDTVGTWQYEVLSDTAAEVFAQSLEEVPYATGNLYNSGLIDVQEASDTNTIIAIAYTADYALPVHEILIPHKNGKAKYLEDPMNEAASILERRVQGAETRILGTY